MCLSVYQNPKYDFTPTPTARGALNSLCLRVLRFREETHLRDGAFLRLRPGLPKAQVTDALLGKSIHPAATLGWRVPVSNYGCRNCALQGEVTLHSAKGRIYLVTVPDCFGVGRRILLIFRKYVAFICIVTIKLRIAFVIQEKL